MAEAGEFPAEAAAFVENAVGPFTVLHTHRDGTGRTGVWEIRSAKGRFFFKTHNRRYKFGSEVYAYRTWATAFAPYAPALVDVLDTPQHFGLLVRALPGQPLRYIDVSDDKSSETYRVAGACLRKLFDAAPANWPWFGCAVRESDGRPLSPVEGIDLGRKTNAVEIVTGQLDDAVKSCWQSEACSLDLPSIKLAARARRFVDIFAGEKPVPTNHDYTPKNWLVNAAGKLTGMIDYEDMYFGFRIDPFIRLEADYFPGHPELRESFIEGFGQDLPRLLPAQTAIKLVVLGLGFLTAGTRESNGSLIDRGRSALALADHYLR